MAKDIRVFARVLFFLSMALFVTSVGATHVWAQAQTATISGTATDTSGAALVSAKVVATNEETNASQSTTTDAQGRYRVSDLPVGTYDVQATLSGFQTVIHKGITLSVGSASVVDFSLPVGKVTETVNVEGNVSQVETQTSEISTLVSPQQMRDMPLNGRNFEQLITLAPGVATVPASENLANFVVGRLYGAQDNYSVSGSRPTGQAFLLDGTDIRDFWEHATGSGYAGTSLGVEAIGQFQVLTNTYDAQFAGNGVVINAASRSGTNDLHGGAYEYFRNNHLDSAALSDKDASILAADAGSSLPSPPPFTRNQFGVALGGPIKKDKLFFFGNYEGLRENLTTSVAPIYMPMGYEMEGELPCTVMAIGSAGCTAGPYSGAPGSATNPLVSVPAFNGSALATSNLTRMTDIMKLYALCAFCATKAPPPTGSPLDEGGYYTTSLDPPLITKEDYAMGRIDYVLSSNDSVFGRYTFDDARLNDGPRSLTGIFPEDDYTRNQFLTITEKHIVSSTLLNSLRFGYTRVKEASYSQTHLTSAQLSKVGLTSDPLDFVSAAGYPDAAGRPDADLGASVNAIAGISFPGLGPDADRPDDIVQSKWSGGDDVVWTHGAHSVELGGVVARVDTNNEQLAYASGQDYLSFTDVFETTNNFPTLPCVAPGVCFGQFGYLEPFFQGTADWGYFVNPGGTNATRYFREIEVAPYLQDTWKLTSRLTITLGIRYDYATNPVGWSGGNLPLSTVTGSFLPPIGPLATFPNCSGISQATSTAAYAQCALGLFTPVKHVFANNINAQNWAPRAGFAFDPFSDHKTSIRGGFGIFHDPVAARIYESGFIGTQPAASFEFDNLFGTRAASFNPCIPDPFAVVAGYCGWTNPAPGEFAAVGYQDPNGSPYLMQFNFDVQHQIAAGTVLSVAYVGSLGRHEWMQRDENPLECSTFPNCSAIPTVSDPNSGACFSAACGDTNINPATGAITTINPNYGSRVTEFTTSSSSYSSLQVSLNRQFAKNISGQVNYTYSHCIDDGSFATSLEEWGQLMTDPYNQRYDYGNCNFDIRHNLSTNALYSLPFKGNRLVEGWQFATIVSFNTGMPLNVANSAFPSDPSGLTEQWGTRPNYTMAAGCSPNELVKKFVTPPGGAFEAYQWFNPACYTPQDAGYLGNVKRNSLQGPHIFNQDFSILKNTKITEKLNMQFRAEFFNILNHFNPAPPSTVLGTAGDVPTGFTNTNATPPRQIQFAVKLDF